MRAGAKGIKTKLYQAVLAVLISPELKATAKALPLHTLRSDIDYAWEEAMTAYGKTWCQGLDLPW